MIEATYNDKLLVVDMLCKSFNENKSINYVAKQDSKRKQRIKYLMEYSFEYTQMYGKVYFSDNKKAVALVLSPEKKSTSIKGILIDLKLALNTIGISRIPKVLKRESEIKKHHPKDLMYHLWFVGVYPENQGKGYGSSLIQEIIDKSIIERKAIFLETSTLKNLPWYQKFGFKIIDEVNLTYKLFIMKREPLKVN